MELGLQIAKLQQQLMKVQQSKILMTETGHSERRKTAAEGCYFIKKKFKKYALLHLKPQKTKTKQN